MNHFDLNQDGEPELIVAYEQGVVEVFLYDEFGHPQLIYSKVSFNFLNQRMHFLLRFSQYLNLYLVKIIHVMSNAFIVSQFGSLLLLLLHSLWFVGAWFTELVTN